MADSGTVYVSSNSSYEDPHEVQKQTAKLEKIAEERNNIIYEVSSVFPFQLFPDKVIIDENTVTIVRKELFFKRIFPIIYEDITTVRINRTIFFASLEFEIKRFELNPRPITFLWPEKADEARKYIMALVQAKREGVSFSGLSVEDVKRKLLEIGKTEEGAKHLF